MRINEISKISEILNNNSVFKENNAYAAQMKNALNSVNNYANINKSIDTLVYSANNLRTYAESLTDTDTSYKNPVSGNIEQTNQTIDSIQADRLKNQITKFVGTYNETLKNTIDISVVNNELSKIASSENLEKIGITKTKDGSLQFDLAKYNESIKSGETKIYEIKTYTSDIENLTAKTTQVINTGKSDLDELMIDAKNQIAELQSNFTTEQNDYLKNSLNALFNANSLQSLLAGIGIGRNLNDIV